MPSERASATMIMHRCLSVFRQFFRLVLLLCCCWLLTGPQLLLQLGAWSWMVANYSQESSIEQAFVETFGGERPCELCKIITAVDTAEQESAPNKEPTEIKGLKLLLGQAEHFNAAPKCWIAPKGRTTEQSAATRHKDVPTPPPRRA